jgi:phage virion morphogenesis protein
MAVEITFDGEYLVRMLAAVRNQLLDNAMQTSIGLSLLAENEKRHNAGLAPDGTPWTSLKPKTIARKTNPRMLVEHGDMLRFYSHPGHDGVTIGTVDKKAWWHHAGTARGLPARPLVGFAAADRALVTELIDDHLRLILQRVR